MGLSREEYQTAQKNGISRQLAYQRVEVEFWDVEDAITRPVRYKDPYYVYWLNRALKNGLSYGAFRQRIRKGMTFKDAAMKPKDPGKGAGRPKTENKVKSNYKKPKKDEERRLD